MKWMMELAGHSYCNANKYSVVQCPAKSPFGIIFEVFKFFDFP